MLIHCTMEELIAIRDGEGSAAAKEHLEGCDQCMMEMERLYQTVAALKALPTFDPPRDRWDEISSKLQADRRGVGRRTFGWAGLAAAAILVLTFGLRTVAVGLKSNPENDRVVVLMERSQDLESMLRELKPRTRVLNGRTASTVVQLEDQIQLVDDRISSLRRSNRVPRADLETLWRQRVRLMDALVTVHSDGVRYVGF